MASLLVIGGSGFFGKSILDAFKRGLLEPWSIDHIKVLARSASHLVATNPDLISKKVSLYDLDITRCTELPFADYVIHAAASTDVRNYLSRPKEERINIQLGTTNFCKLAPRYLSQSKILYVSSGAVYGQQPAHLEFIHENAELEDIATLEPGKQGYAAAKREAESHIIGLGREGLNVAIARCFAFVGLHLPRHQHFAIGNFIEDGLSGRPITVKARHTVYRSYLYADDLVSWLMTIVAKSTPYCSIINVGSSEAVLMSDLAKQMAQYFGVEAIVPALTESSVDRYVPSIQRALVLGCQKPLSLESAISATIAAIGNYNI
jgi:nucleoside-diphosphate-sugar epimerase